MLDWYCMTWYKTLGCLHWSYRNSTHCGDLIPPKTLWSGQLLYLYESLRLHTQETSLFIQLKNMLHCLCYAHESKMDEQSFIPRVKWCPWSVPKPPLGYPQYDVSTWPVHLVAVSSAWQYPWAQRKWHHSLLPKKWSAVPVFTVPLWMVNVALRNKLLCISHQQNCEGDRDSSAVLF